LFFGSLRLMLGHGVLLVSGFSNDLYSEQQTHNGLLSREDR
jgi:hypothetical protein